VRGLTSLLLGITLWTPSLEASPEEGPSPTNHTEFSAGYQLMGPAQTWHGWNASLSRGFGSKGFGWVVDGGSVYPEGSPLTLLTTGPRFSYRADKDATLYAQVLAGVWIESGPDVLPIAYPGVGVDFRPDETLGFRLQLDWPLVTPFGVITAVPRVSAGIVIRPGTR